MQPMRYIIIIFFSLITQSSLLAKAPTLQDLSGELNLFARAEHALKNHDIKNYQALLAKLQSYPLYPYLIYEDLKQKIETEQPTRVTLQQLKDFNSAYPDFPFHRSLRSLWLKQMATTKNWSALVEGYQPSKNVILECQYYFGKYQLTQNKTVLNPVKQLWLVGYSQPPECDAVFSLWKKNGDFTVDLLWERFRLALENKNFTLVQHLLKQLSPAEQDVGILWENLIKNPSLINNPDILQKVDTASNKIKAKISTAEILTIVLPLFASIHAENAAQWWKTHEKEYSFSQKQANQIYRDITVQLSRQKSPLANEWLIHVPPAALDLTTQEWRVRVSISKLDWRNTLKWIRSLTTSYQTGKKLALLEGSCIRKTWRSRTSRQYLSTTC